MQILNTKDHFLNHIRVRGMHCKSAAVMNYWFLTRSLKSMEVEIVSLMNPFGSSSKISKLYAFKEFH